MMTRFQALAGALALAAALPAAASAADIHADEQCYRNAHGTVAIAGSGFEPDQPYAVTLDGQPVDTGGATTDAAGGVTASFPTPVLADDGAEHRYTLAVSQGANVAQTRFSVTPFLADFSPGSGNPRTLKVRFSVLGFGLVRATPPVYLHYVRPDGELKRTIKLGQALGVCGHITATRKRRLFPFAAERGKWRLQFDTRKRYRKGVMGADFLYFALGVRIRKISG